MSRCMECIQHRLMVERELKKGNFVEKDGVVYFKKERGQTKDVRSATNTKRYFTIKGV